MDGFLSGSLVVAGAADVVVVDGRTRVPRRGFDPRDPAPCRRRATDQRGRAHAQREQLPDGRLSHVRRNGDRGSDYTSKSGTLTIGAGSSSGSIEVPVLDDEHNEGSETLTLTLSNPSSGTLTDDTATGTISNHDALPAALVARFGRTAAPHVVETVEERVNAPLAPGFDGRVAGQRPACPAGPLGAEAGRHAAVCGRHAGRLAHGAHAERPARNPPGPTRCGSEPARKTVSGPGGKLTSTSAAANRLRTVIEGSQSMTIANRMALTPSVEVGIRQDGGDAEVGRGLDLGLGLVLADGVAGLTVDVGALRRLVHGAERRLGARRRARQGRGDADAVERLVGAADGRGDDGDHRERDPLPRAPLARFGRTTACTWTSGGRRRGGRASRAVSQYGSCG